MADADKPGAPKAPLTVGAVFLGVWRWGGSAALIFLITLGLNYSADVRRQFEVSSARATQMEVAAATIAGELRSRLAVVEERIMADRVADERGRAMTTARFDRIEATLATISSQVAILAATARRDVALAVDEGP